MDPHDPTPDVHHSLPSTLDLEVPVPLTAEEIRAKAGMREADVDVPGLGLIHMRTPTMLELRDLAIAAKGDELEATVQAIILCCPAFSQEDAGWLRSANGLMMTALSEALQGFGVKPVSIDETAATFRAPTGPVVRVDPEPGLGDPPRAADD